MVPLFSEGVDTNPILIFPIQGVPSNDGSRGWLDSNKHRMGIRPAGLVPLGISYPVNPKTTQVH
jgi:hypothetical protein